MAAKVLHYANLKEGDAWPIPEPTPGDPAPAAVVFMAPATKAGTLDLWWVG